MELVIQSLSHYRELFHCITHHYILESRPDPIMPGVIQRLMASLSALQYIRSTALRRCHARYIKGCRHYYEGEDRQGLLALSDPLVLLLTHPVFG